MEHFQDPLFIVVVNIIYRLNVDTDAVLHCTIIYLSEVIYPRQSQ